MNNITNWKPVFGFPVCGYISREMIKDRHNVAAMLKVIFAVDRKLRKAIEDINVKIDTRCPYTSIPILKLGILSLQ